MHIVVSTDPDTVVLDDAEDFTAFDVVAPSSADDDLDRRLGPLAQRDGDHLWVDLEELAALAGTRATDADWQTGLAAMVDYARSKGFLSDDGSALRAHIVWRD